MHDHHDALETRTPEDRLSQQLSALRAQLQHARAHAAAYRDVLSALDVHEVQTLSDLARLPLTRKSDMHEAQQRTMAQGDPFGGYSAVGWGKRQGALRVFQSPGPIYEPQGPSKDHWRLSRALYAAGIRSGDLIHNSFSYHLTPAGAMLEAGAHALGCTVFPGGVGNTELQLQAMLDLRPDAYVGTPSFLRILLEKAQTQGTALPHLRKALVTGEAFPQALRQQWQALGIEAYQCYATADLGLIAYETSAREGLVVDEGILLEIVRPGTGDPVEPGEVGEVVVTCLDPAYPLIRFATGDLSAMLPGRCPTGRTNARIKGWLGRADQTAKVRGMFVHPSQIDQVLKRHPAVIKGRLQVHGSMAQDEMTLHVEVPAEVMADGAALQAGLAQTLKDVTKLRGDVQCHLPGSLPNDGKVIADERAI